MRFNSHNKAFTLIELLVVISIIGMLASVVLASLNSARDKGRVGAALTFATNIYHVYGANAASIYDFNENNPSSLADTSGNGNYTLACTNNVVAIDGVVGKALNLPSSSASCGTVSYQYRGFSQNGGSGSISFWIEPTAIPAGANNYIAHVKGLWIGINNSSNIFTSGVFANTWNTVQVPINKWSQVLLSWAPGSVRLYIDGKQVGSDVASTIAFSTDSGSGLPFYLGGYGSEGFVGYLDQFAIYTQSPQTSF